MLREVRRSTALAVPVLAAVAGTLASCVAATDPVAEDLAPPIAEEPSPPAVGRVTGRVVLRGERPERVTFNVSSDAYFEAKNPGGVFDPRFEVNEDGTVPHVTLGILGLRVEAASDHPVPVEPARIEIARANLQPHVLAIREGQAVEIRNDAAT